MATKLKDNKATRKALNEHFANPSKKEFREVPQGATHESKIIPLYYHKTDGGAEYLIDTFFQCDNGHREGAIATTTKYIVRIDGDITKDCELIIK